MLDVSRFIEDTNAATSSDEAVCLFDAALKQLGYDRFCYSLITDHPSLGLKAGHGVAKNYPADWMSHYTANNYQKEDPVPRFCFSTTTPFTWDWLTATHSFSQEQKKIMNEAREAQLLDGAAVPLFGANGELAGVGLASSSGGVRPDINLLSLVRAVAIHFHMVYTEFEKKENLSGTAITANIHLTRREKEILLWAAEGKGDQVIADILGISYAAVRFHMNNVFKKLNVNERTFAIAKAIRHGLILPSYIGAP